MLAKGLKLDRENRLHIAISYNDFKNILNNHRMTKEQILYLASTSPAAMAYLKTLYPQYFETYLDLSEVTAIDNEPRTLAVKSGFGLSPVVWVAKTGDPETQNKAFALAEGYGWELFKIGAQSYLRAKIK